MDFVNPLFLLCASAAAVPIVLHLIMRQKPRHLEFPALRFVQRRQAANQRRLRLRHLLLLLLRVAAICLLAAALARPTITATNLHVSQEMPVAAALVFDTSPRMEYRHENKTRLQVAQETSQWLLGQLPAESQAAVLESKLGSAVFQIDLPSARKRVERLETAAAGKPLFTVLEEALSLLKTSELVRKELYIFTDLARTSWSGDLADRFRERLKQSPGVGLYVIDVGVPSPQDFGLGEVKLSAQVLSKNSPLRVQTELARLGPAAERSVGLYLLDKSGKEQLRSQTALQLAENASQAVDFPVSGLSEGVHQGVVRVAGEDNLGANDERYFTVEVQPSWPLLIAAPSPAEEYAFDFAEALAPSEFRKNDRAQFRLDIVSLDELPRRPLEPYAAVCLLDPQPLSAETWKKLEEFVRGGRGLGIFLGRNAVPIEVFNQPASQSLLPGKLATQARRPEGDLFLSPDTLGHPILAKFRSRAGEIPWDGFPVFRYWRLDELADGASVVIRYSDQARELIERPLGQGRVLTMTTPVSDPSSSDAWNLLPTGFEPWPFLMLANETARYLVGSTGSQLNYQVGQTAVLRLAPGQQVASYLLTPPRPRPQGGMGSAGKKKGADTKERDSATKERSSSEFGTPQRRTIDAARGAIVESSTDWPGQYRVQAGGETGKLDRGFSVNLPPAATDLARIKDDELKQAFGDAKYRLARGRKEIVRDISEGRVGMELFPYLMLLVAAAAGLEHAVANLFYRESKK